MLILTKFVVLCLSIHVPDAVSRERKGGWVYELWRFSYELPDLAHNWKATNQGNVTRQDFCPLIWIIIDRQIMAEASILILRVSSCKWFFLMSVKCMRKSFSIHSNTVVCTVCDCIHSGIHCDYTRCVTHLSAVSPNRCITHRSTNVLRTHQLRYTPSHCVTYLPTGCFTHPLCYAPADVLLTHPFVTYPLCYAPTHCVTHPMG